MTIQYAGRFNRSGGVQGAPGATPRPSITGTRADPFNPAGPAGEQAFRVRSGQVYRDFDVSRLAALARVDQTASGLLICNVAARNMYRLVDGDKAVSLTDFHIEDVTLHGAERGFTRLRGHSSGGLIRRFTVDLEKQYGDPFPQAMHFDENCHHIVVEDGVIDNAWTPVIPGEYRQGDGVCDERGVSDMTYRRVKTRWCMDGGFDLKSSRVTLDDVTGEGNHKNFRLWASGHATRLTSIDPLANHICIHGDKANRSNYVIDYLDVRSTTKAPVIYIDAPVGADVVIKDYSISVPTGTQLVRGGATSKVTWVKPAPKTVKGLIV